MRTGIPPLSPESTLPPSTAPAVPVCALPPVVRESSRRLELYHGKLHAWQEERNANALFRVSILRAWRLLFG